MNPKDYASIEGIVLDAEGSPLPDVPVMIQTSDQDHPDIAAVTDEQGRFRFDGLLPGRYTLAAYSSSGEAFSATTSTVAGRLSNVVLSPS